MFQRIGLLRVAVATLAFASTLAIRVNGTSTHFWMLRDQIRDWSIALGPFSDLPLVGPATHVGGYTIGPAFYWILWAIRVTVGPWFENLPHAGGIGQAILQSGADALLLTAIWRRTESLGIALAAIVLVATAGYDLCLSALVWNPTMGTAFAKAATALVLLGWHRGSATRAALTAAVAWSAVHAYTGAIFVTVGVFTALLADPLARREWRIAKRNAAIIVLTVALLQLPYLVHQVSNRFSDSAMGAVSGSVGRILSGSDRPEISKSVAGYAGAFEFIEVSPWRSSIAAWILLASGGILAIRYRRDPSLLAVTLVPQVAAIIGYALFLDDLDHYYYLSLMPAAVLTVVLAATAVPSPRVARVLRACYEIAVGRVFQTRLQPGPKGPGRRPVFSQRALGMALLLGALALVPARVRFAATMHRMPEYGVLVEASRKIKNQGQPMRAIRTDFALPPTADPEFLYGVLGGRIDRRSPWEATIGADGNVAYRRVEGS